MVGASSHPRSWGSRGGSGHGRSGDRPANPNWRFIMSPILDRFFRSSPKAPLGSTRAVASRRRRMAVAVESLEGRILQAADLFGVGTDWRVYELALDAA